MGKNHKRSHRVKNSYGPIPQPNQNPNEGAGKKTEEQRHPPEGKAQQPQNPNVATQEQGAEGGAQKPTPWQIKEEIRKIAQEFLELRESLEDVLKSFDKDKSIESSPGYKILDEFKEKWDRLCNEDVKKYGVKESIIEDYEKFYRGIKNGIDIMKRKDRKVPPKDVILALKLGPASILNELFTDEIEMLEAEVEDLDKKLDAAQQSNQNLRTELNDMRKDVDRKEKEANELSSDLEKKIETLEAGKKILETEAEKLHTDLHDTLKGNKEMSAKIKTLRYEAENNKKMLSNYEAEIKKLEKMLSEAQVSIKNSEKKNDKISKKSKSIKEIEEQVKDLKKKLEEALKEKRVAEKEHEKTRNEKKALEEKFNSFSSTAELYQKASKVVSDTQKSLTRANKNLEQLKDTNNQYAAMNKRLVDLNNALMKKCKESTEERFRMSTALTDELNKRNKQIKGLKKLLDDNNVPFDKNEFAVTEEKFEYELAGRKLECKDKIDYTHEQINKINYNILSDGAIFMMVIQEAFMNKKDRTYYTKDSEFKSRFESYLSVCTQHHDLMKKYNSLVSKTHESLDKKEWPTKDEHDNFLKEYDDLMESIMTFSEILKRFDDRLEKFKISIYKRQGKTMPSSEKSDEVKQDSGSTDETKEVLPNTVFLACDAQDTAKYIKKDSCLNPRGTSKQGDGVRVSF